MDAVGRSGFGAVWTIFKLYLLGRVTRSLCLDFHYCVDDNVGYSSPYGPATCDRSRTDW